MQGLIEFVKTLGPTRLAAMGAVTVALIGFFALLIMRVTAPVMVPLFTDLSLEDSSAIIKDLERQVIPYEMRNDGATLMVPKDRVSRLRMKLAEGGLPKGGGVGYEIFDKSDTLGSTSFVQNINHLRALEGELARTIRALDRVQFARVHLVMPERTLFSRDQAEPSASIVLQGARGALEGSKCAPSATWWRPPSPGSRRNGCRSSMRPGACSPAGHPTIRPSAACRTSARPASSGACGTRSRRSYPRWSAPAAPGSSSPRISISTASPRPRSGSTPRACVLRSTQTKEESSGNIDPSGQVSVANELPGGQANANSNRDNSKKSEEIANYEVSRTTKTEVVEGGRINRISVAVLVDGSYVKSDKGDVAYQQRSRDELDRIGALVRSTIGFDQRRGDQVEVVNLR